MTNQHVESFLYINEHRVACDREPFKELTEAEIDENLALIEQHAGNGEDPWSGLAINYPGAPGLDAEERETVRATYIAKS